MNPLLDEKQVYLCENADNTLSIMLDASGHFILTVPETEYLQWRKLACDTSMDTSWWFGVWGFRYRPNVFDPHSRIEVSHVGADFLCYPVGSIVKENKP